MNLLDIVKEEIKIISHFKAPIREQESVMRCIDCLDKIQRDIDQSGSLIAVQLREEDFLKFKWPEERITGTNTMFDKMSLSQLLEDDDSIGIVTEDHIEIIKKSGTIHIYEKNNGESENIR